ncbi:MAG: AsmA family protein [Burkholderiales bacterium]
MKIAKYFAYSVVGLVILCIAALAAVAFVVDGAFVKSRLERYLKEEKQRTLSIEGEPKVRFFPVAGLSLGKTTLSEHASDKTFLALDSLEVGVRVFPILSGEIAVEALSLSGLKVNIVKAKNGQFNFQDLLGSAKDKGEKPAGAEASERRDPPKLRIAEVKIDNSQMTFRDEVSGQEVAVTGFNFKTGRLEDDAPSPIALSVSISGKRPDIGLNVTVAGSARMNLARQSLALAKLDAKVNGNAANLNGLNLGVTGDFAVDGTKHLVDVNALKVEANGTLDRDTLTLSLSAPRIEVTSSKASGSAVTGNLKIAGPQRSVNANLKIDAVSGSASALSIPAFNLDVDASAEGNNVKARLGTPILASLAAKSLDLPKIVAEITLSGPMVPQKTVTLPIQASFKVDMSKQTMASEIATKFDESTIQAKLGASKLQPLNANFDVNIDKLNLDRYLRPSSEKSAGDPPVDLAALKGKTVNGKIQIGALQAQKVKLANIKAEIKLAGGKLDVAPHSANLYGGSISGSLSADASGNRIAIKEAVQGVSINPLLVDLADKDILEGKGDVSLDVTMAGATVGAMKRALAGNAKLTLKDGAYKGINLAETFRKASSIGSKSGTQSGDKTQKTDFSEMSASFVIKNGVAHNEDLSLKSPFVRVGGSGDIDIGNSKLDYTAKASLVATATGQQGRDDASGITVPVKVYGTFDAVKYDIQYGALFSGIGRSIGNLFGGGKSQEAAPAKGAAAPSTTDAVKDRLKGLFGR